MPAIQLAMYLAGAFAGWWILGTLVATPVSMLICPFSRGFQQKHGPVDKNLGKVLGGAFLTVVVAATYVGLPWLGVVLARSGELRSGLGTALQWGVAALWYFGSIDRAVVLNMEGWREQSHA